MNIIPTALPEVLIIEPDVFGDERGYFFESYHVEKFREAGIPFIFVQDNESKSAKGVLRGLHYQSPPFEQGKLVRVIKGRVLDVAVDIRSTSPTFGKWVSVELSESNKRMCWIPSGFAHGFVSLEEGTIFSYKCTQLYNKAAERSIRWNDPQLAIHWGYDKPLLSAKDETAPLLHEIIPDF